MSAAKSPIRAVLVLEPFGFLQKHTLIQKLDSIMSDNPLPNKRKKSAESNSVLKSEYTNLIHNKKAICNRSMLPVFTITKEGILRKDIPKNIDQIRQKIREKEKMMNSNLERENTVIPVASFVSQTSSEIYDKIKEKLKQKMRLKKQYKSKPTYDNVEYQPDILQFNSAPVSPALSLPTLPVQSFPKPRIGNLISKNKHLRLSSTVADLLTPKNMDQELLSPDEFKIFIESHLEDLKSKNLFVISRPVKCSVKYPVTKFKTPSPLLKFDSLNSEPQINTPPPLIQTPQPDEMNEVPALPKIKISPIKHKPRKALTTKKQRLDAGIDKLATVQIKSSEIFKNTTVNDSFSNSKSVDNESYQFIFLLSY